MTLIKAIFYAVLFLAILAIFPMMVIWTDGNLEYWVHYFKGEWVNIPWYFSTMITMVFNGVALAFNIFTELFKLSV